MKVLQMLGGGPWGGGSVVVLAVVRGQVARGDDVYVASADQEELDTFGAAGARPVKLPRWYRAIHPLDALPLVHLFRLCRKERFDLVVNHSSKGGFLGRIAARLAGTPYIIYQAHAFYFHHKPPGLARRFFVALEKFAAKAGDLTITVSEQHRQAAIREGVEEPERILTIPNGIDVRRFRGASRAAARSSLGCGDSEITIGAVGRLAKDKGYEYLIGAMPAILATQPRARLVIAGNGPLEAELRQRSKALGVEGSVSFLGFRQDVADLLRGFDIFVQPSLREGLSISLIEALAAGIPIVACDIPENREVVDHEETGLLVAPANAPALASAVVGLLDNPSRARELAARACEVAQARFSTEQMVERNLEAYSRLTKRARPAAMDQGRKREFFGRWA